jgi:diguanylate cyclase (GGDEF)-like protein
MAHRLARRLLMSTRSSFVGYGLQSLLLAEVVPGDYLWPWVAAMVFGETVNGSLARLLQRSVNQPSRRTRYSVLLLFGLSFTGIVWGSAVLLPGVRESLNVLMLQETILAVIGVMSIQNLSFLPGCLAVFAVGMATPTLWASLVVHSIPPALGFGAIALVVVGQVYGWMTRKLVLESIDAHILNEQVTASLQSSNQALLEALQALDRLASVDHLTQCLNRRAMVREIEREYARCQRQHTTFGLIMLDLDHFKAINDQFGHAAGDTVLMSTASALRRQLRPTDLLARWGGEEFLCLLSQVDDEALLQKAESMRSLIEVTATQVAGKAVCVTISLGVVLARSCDRSIEELIDAADRALYMAKTGGRNRVCAAAGTLPGTDREPGRLAAPDGSTAR